ncbi:prosalusin isoform X1 [Pelobates cultripes]|uniref:Torsin n=1 Tax=Pelobates cultripes TaxID=61616 RepID=A0AAD1T1E6_PELCU|nr:prosalusin isoform X1 [Pelobates cultripes]
MAADWWQITLVVLIAGFVNPWELSALHCSFYNFCECGFRPNLNALECELARSVFGQHLACDLVVKAVKQFVETDSPTKPLVLSFHGWTGSGKTFLSSLLVKHLYKDGTRNPHVHYFSPILHFAHAQNVELYKEDLRQWIQGNLTQCSRSVFVFEEMDKMHPGIIDVLVPFLGPSWVVYGTNYRKAIFIFISNAGGDVINQVALDFWRDRKDREEIQLRHLQSAISIAVMSTPEHGFWKSQIMNQSLIDVIVPFLPLRPSHIRQCIQKEAEQQELEYEEDTVQSILNNLVYFPEDEKVFSSTGCKTVSSRVSYFL